MIQYNQTGYVKDRFIGEAIRSIFDIMDLFTAVYRFSKTAFDSVGEKLL